MMKNLNSRYICASACEPNVKTARVPGDATTETRGLILKEENKPTCKMQRESFTDSNSHCSNLLSCIFHVSLLFWLWIPFSFICSSSTSKMPVLFFFFFSCESRVVQSSQKTPRRLLVTWQESRCGASKPKVFLHQTIEASSKFATICAHHRRRTAWLRGCVCAAALRLFGRSAGSQHTAERDNKLF